MSLDSAVMGIIRKYKVTIFFILTYWVLDPILYWHFQNAYLAGVPGENKILVFLSGPFSFSEDFQANTPFWQALATAGLSGNFWIPVFTIWFVEWKVQDNFHIGGFKITVWKSYLIGVLASYITSTLNWALPHPHSPISGTSITAFALWSTYFVFYPMVMYRIQKRDKNIIDIRILNSLYASLSAALFIAIWFYVVNLSNYLHVEGICFYSLIYMYCARKTIHELEPALTLYLR